MYTTNLNTILNNINDAVLVHDNGNPVYVNAPYLTLMGFESAKEYEVALESTGVFGQLHPNDLERVMASHNERMTGVNSGTKYYSVRLRKRDTEYHWVDLKICSIDWNGKHLVMVCLQDSNEIINRSNSNTHYQSLFDQIIGSIPAVITLTTVDDGIYQHVSDMFETVLGYQKKEVLGKSAYDLKIWVHEEEREHIVKTLESGRQVEDFPCSTLSKEGDIIPVSIWARIIECEPRNMILLVGFDRSGDIKKIEHIEMLNENLNLLATTDAMTGIFNRRHFLEEAVRILSLAKRHNLSISVIICDIDNFKNINDTYGHNVGDEAIIAFAKAIENCLRKEDLLARWGGEEFVAILPNTSCEQAVLLAERIREETEKLEIHLGKRKIKFTASFGVALFNQDCSDVADVINLADIALYRAKEEGRNRVISNIIG